MNFMEYPPAFSVCTFNKLQRQLFWIHWDTTTVKDMKPGEGPIVLLRVCRGDRLTGWYVGGLNEAHAQSEGREMRRLSERLKILELQDKILAPTFEGMSNEEWQGYLKEVEDDAETAQQRIEKLVGRKFTF
jgi:hypothetical protein